MTATHSTIRSYYSTSLQVEFLEEPSTKKLVAKTPDMPDYLPVELPDARFLSKSAFTSVEKIERLLNNCHLRPAYEPIKNTVSFEPIPPINKTWIRASQHPLPSSDTKWIPRASGAISYISGNSVVTWDHVQGTSKTISYQAHTPTCIAEHADGTLIVADGENNLHVNDKLIKIPFTEKIWGISTLLPPLVLIKLDSRKIVLNPLTGETLLNLEGCDFFRVLNNQHILSFKDKKIILYKYDIAGKAFTSEEHDSTAVKSLRAIKNSDTKVLLLKNDGKSVEIWDVEKNTKTPFVYEYIHSKNMSHPVYLLSDDTIAHQINQTRKFRFVQITSNEKKESSELGHWFITCHLLLSDGSIMFATNTSSSGIHIIDHEGATLLSTHELTGNGSAAVSSLKELSNGCVAGLFNSSLVILKPLFRAPMDNNYKIEKLRLELKHNPYQLEYYQELADLNEADDEKYSIYLSGLEAAIRLTNLYQSRRFYEKAKRIKPDEKEPCEIFYRYLIHSPYKKLRKKVALDLFRITKDNSLLEKTNKYKHRLLIGEGTFTYTEALIKKHEETHPGLAKFITATEYRNSIPEGTEIRCAALREKGVTVSLEIDGQRIHEQFKSHRFHRIQWNCPFGNSGPQAREVFKIVIPKFFQSAAQLQQVGDRIHVTLVQGNDYYISRQTQNPIVDGATSASYRLIRKRVFGRKRYPEYVHMQTDGVNNYTAGGKEREFVFEKTNKTPQSTLAFARELINTDEKKYEIKQVGEEENLKQCYFECSSDEDSSDYYESD